MWLILKFQRRHFVYSSLPGNYSTSFFKDQTAGASSHSVPLNMIMSFIGLFFVKKARYLINIHWLVKGLQKTQACNEKCGVIWKGGLSCARAHAWRSEDILLLWESVLSFPQVGLGNATQIAKHSSLPWLGHLTCPWNHGLRKENNTMIIHF